MTRSPQFKSEPDEALAAYRQQGFHVEYDMWPDDVCDALVAEALKLAKERGESYAPLMQPHRASDRFLEAMRFGPVVEVMSKLVGDSLSGLQSEFFFGAPGTRGFSPHQDNFFVEAGNDQFASAWSAMTDVTVSNGGLYAFPGTHLEGILPVAEVTQDQGANQDPNANNEASVVPDQYRPVDVEVPKGATLFLHGNIVHGSHVNTSDRFRYALLCTYLRAGSHFRPGRHAKREEVPLTVGAA